MDDERRKKKAHSLWLIKSLDTQLSIKGDERSKVSSDRSSNATSSDPSESTKLTHNILKKNGNLAKNKTVGFYFFAENLIFVIHRKFNSKFRYFRLYISSSPQRQFLNE